MNTDARAKFQQLLRELFQFDVADLDFGIYRVMNLRRQAIERFIEEELLNAVSEELRTGLLVQQEADTKLLRAVAGEVRNLLGSDAIDDAGNLRAQHLAMRESTGLIGDAVRRYVNLKEATVGTRDPEALEADVFNHLYAFFGRYYDSGDFLSKRRYGKSEKYCIPYNGEEVVLHWANRDQYYIKTAEHFTSYQYKASHGVTVRFRIETADVEQDNNKGAKRFFVPLTDRSTYDAAARTVTIPFAYRPLTAEEEARYDQHNQQDAINADAYEHIPLMFKGNDDVLAALVGEYPPRIQEHVTLLQHHLRQYTRRNTSDYFIHKDLAGFLTRELDFYLKHEVLLLGDIESVGERRAEGWFHLMRAMRAVGGRIITFLAQIEDFQKQLYEKKKFVTSARYCITMAHIPTLFHAEIAACEAQWDEWCVLGCIGEEHRTLSIGTAEGRIAFLVAHPTLVLDTKHFDENFRDRLLATFDDLDAVTDGLLIHSENFQALTFLLDKYREQIKCVYIDPPYNSKTSEILYKNNYKHSSWLALIDNRLEVSRLLAAKDGSHIVAIDENEYEMLGLLLAMHFPESDYEKVAVAIVHNKKGIQGAYFSYNHEYAYFCIPRTLARTNGRVIPDAEWEHTNLRKWGRESERSTAKNCFYPIFVEGDRIVGFGDVCDEHVHPKRANAPSKDGAARVAVYPIDAQGIERKWRYARASIEAIRDLLKVHVTSSGEIQIHKAAAEKQWKTVWDDSKYIAGDYGTKWLTDLGLKLKDDLYPKSIYTVADAIRAVDGEDARVLDYFAGSGTTGHATIVLNREDGGARKFVLVEMGEYFETVLLPRLKKVTYAPEWKEGKPAREASEEEAQRSPRIMKVLTLERYEDALNNIDLDEQAGQAAMKLHRYMLSYMLRWEAKRSATLLNVEHLEAPFSYTLKTFANGASGEQRADIAETFAYLLGMRVQTRRIHRDGDRRYLVYRGTLGPRTVVVLWRDIVGWKQEDYTRDKHFVATGKIVDGTDDVFVNGDSTIPRAQPLDGLFKQRMLGTDAGVWQ